MTILNPAEQRLEASDFIKSLAFRTRKTEIITLVETFLLLIDGLSEYFEDSLFQESISSLEEELVVRYKTYVIANPIKITDNETKLLCNALMTCMLECRLPFLCVTNQNNHSWSPFDMPFFEFAKSSKRVKVSLGSVSQYKMTDLLGVSYV